ncbi:DUF6249 domain-containing protein [Brevundimonas viscosa]|uniref:DUF6249 domain-containing protein n=1 Tax=Brevundimonas viscosa TaxID=871741 RepID=A0A1I6PUY1_9CAUL|nr:DUF6249 domain-containing protein [Brevundimonas viscosa]SFS44014.1 hypothetical protein SAMN05192570_1301 [Brevundimonas viscosa]
MEDFIPVFAIFAVFGTITAIVVGPSWLKSREKREMQATLRHAMDKGQTLPPEVIDALTQDVSRNLPSRSRDIRRGVIWLAVGIGIGAFGLINDLSSGGSEWGPNVGDGLLGIAAIPVTIGLAFIVLSFFNKNKD